MSTSRYLTLIAVFALAACTTPPRAEPTIRKTDTTPAAGGIVVDTGTRTPAPAAGSYTETTTAPATGAPAVPSARPRPTGGSVREMVESYPVQR